MSGSDDATKDLELENDVVETQGSVRYRQAANMQNHDDLSDFDDEDFLEDVTTELKPPDDLEAKTQPAGAFAGKGAGINVDIQEDYWEEDEEDEQSQEVQAEQPVLVRHRLPVKKQTPENEDEIKQSGGTIRHKLNRSEQEKPRTNLVVKLLEKNPLGMTLPEMAGGVRKQKRIKTLRPMLQQAIKDGLIMPVSQRAGHTVYKLVKHIGPR